MDSPGWTSQWMAAVAAAGRTLAAGRRRRQAVLDRADQQHRWAVRGDPRGVYGQQGAALMGSVAPGPASPGAMLRPPGPDLPVAQVVHTDTALAALLSERLPSWRYAAFVSVLVQRRSAVRSRLRDARMAFAEPVGPLLDTAGEAGLFFTAGLSDLSELLTQVDAFMTSAAFQEAFGDPHDGDSADGEAIVHAAHRLMDHHDRFLALSERIRRVRVPYDCRELHRDFAALTVVPLDGFGTFIDEFTDRVSEMADVARFATGDIELDPVTLNVNDENGILERVSERLQRISRFG